MSLSPTTSDDVMSSPSHQHTYNYHPNQDSLEEEVDQETVARSDFWKLVDTPEFVPGQPFRTSVTSNEDETEINGKTLF